MPSHPLFSPQRRQCRSSRRAFLQGAVAGAAIGSGPWRSVMGVRPSDNGPPAANELVARLRGISVAHPRLHFDSGGSVGLRRRASGSHRRYARLLFDWAERHQAWAPPATLPQAAGTEVLLEEAGAFVTNFALTYVLSGEDRHLAVARRCALALCDVPRGELRNYGLGIYAAGLARAYDWLYEQWTPAERQRIRSHLARLVEQVYHGSLPHHERRQWWADTHLHHDHWIPVGGYGEAALALLGEVEEAAVWAAGAKLDFDVCLSWLGEDGAWHEGAADWCYALAPLLWFYGAWQSVVGEDLHDVAWLRNTAAYRLYHWLPDDTYVYLNDSFRSGRYNTSGSASCHLLRRLASLFRDGHAQWLAERDEAFDLRAGATGVYQAPYERASFQDTLREYPHPASQCVAWNMLWYDPDVRARAPTELPPSRQFANMGVVILRTGWGPGAAVASFAGGPLAGHRCARRMRAGEPRSTGNYSHAHADYNAFTLFARGEYFVVPPGYARRSSHFQNTVLVNGADLLADASLQLGMVGFRMDDKRGFSYAVSDAAAAFLPEVGVRRYRRHLLLLHRGLLVIFDDVELESSGGRMWNRFQWTVHSDPRSHHVKADGSCLRWQPHERKTPRLVLHVLEPQAFGWEHVQLESLEGEAMLAAHRLVRPEWYSDRMQVLSVLTWTEDEPAPSLLRHRRFLAAATATGPVVGFALSPLEPRQLKASDPPELADRALWLFGCDPARPDALYVVGD